jgi:mRNA-degrading endonuclease toxin of MazEF toxin-antitoxin module
MKRGDIVLCRFPHASGTPVKLRPALVVQSDYYNSRISNALVAGITSNMSNAADPAHFLIDVATADGQTSGLTRNSLVSCINLAVVPRRFIERTIGTLSADLMQSIDNCLRTAIGL